MSRNTDRWDLPHLVPWLIYAALYLVVACLGVQQDLAQHYPVAYVAADIACNALNWLAVTLFAFRFRPAAVWRWAKLLFPVVVVELLVGLVLDATIPKDFNLMHDGLQWLAAAALGLLCVTPAYYAGFRLSYARQGMPGRPKDA